MDQMLSSPIGQRDGLRLAFSDRAASAQENHRMSLWENCTGSSQKNRQILCNYTNTTRQIQIARIPDVTHCYLERAVLPGECLQFQALPEAHLEIHTSTIASAILTDKIPCDRLQMTQASVGRGSSN